MLGGGVDNRFRPLFRGGIFGCPAGDFEFRVTGVVTTSHPVAIGEDAVR